MKEVNSSLPTKLALRSVSPELFLAGSLALLVLVSGCRRIQLERLLAHVAELEQAVSNESGLLSARDALGLDERLASAFIPSSTRAQALTALTAQVRRQFLNANADILDIKASETSYSDDHPAVSLDVSAEMAPKDLDELVRRFSEHEPYLFVSSADIRKSSDTGQPSTQLNSERLAVKITVEAFTMQAQ